MLKVAQIQFDPQIGQAEKNLQKAEFLINQSGGSGLLVLPELANCGYNFIDRKQALALASEPLKSDYVEMMVEASKKHGFSIVSGFHEKEGNELFNTSLLISKKGIIGKYRKIHLFMNEKDIFCKGNLGLPVYQIDNYTLGMLICFDYLFPEVWRILALKGADLVAHPSNLVTKFAHKVVPAQAIMNRIFVFTTNRIGTERNLTFTGKSFAVNPLGDIINQSGEGEEIIFTDFDLLFSRNKMITERNHVLNDRSANDYREII